jgi:hypothetical protein
MDADTTIDPMPHAKCNPVQLVCKLHEAGQPAVLSINDQVKLVVEDTTSFQMLLELVDRLDTIKAIREGLKEIDQGKGVSVEEAMDQVRKKYGIPLRVRSAKGMTDCQTTATITGTPRSRDRGG